MIESRRILIVSTMFYPAPWVATVRITQWCRFLPRYGWKPSVLCRYYGHAATPEMLAQSVHPDVTVDYFNPPPPPPVLPVSQAPSASPDQRPATTDPPSGKPKPKPTWMQNILQQWSVPDTSIYFWRSSKTRQRALQAVDEIRPDVILTTSPPHSNHDIGLWLHRQRSIPWVADFRDPYVIDQRYQPRGLGKIRWPMHRGYEEAIYRNAALTVHAIPIQARWARMRYPFARDRVKILTNGCPPELADESVDPDLSKPGRRSVRVIGFCGDEESLALANAVAGLVGSGNDIELRLVGPQTGCHDEIKSRLGDRYVSTGFIRHDQALRQIVGADVLVCPLSSVRSKNLLLSSKLFEYLATGKPTIVINPSLPDRQLLRRVPQARVLHQPTQEDIAEAITAALDPANQPSAQQVDQIRTRYNRVEQTRDLAGWLDQVAK